MICCQILGALIILVAIVYNPGLREHDLGQRWIFSQKCRIYTSLNWVAIGLDTGLSPIGPSHKSSPKNWRWWKSIETNKFSLTTLHLNRFPLTRQPFWSRQGSPRKQSSWGQHGAHLGPVGPRLAPCWPHEHCYQGSQHQVELCNAASRHLHLVQEAAIYQWSIVCLIIPRMHHKLGQYYLWIALIFPGPVLE